MPDATLAVVIDADEETATTELRLDDEIVSGTRRLSATGHAPPESNTEEATTISLPKDIDSSDVSVYPTAFEGGYGALLFVNDDKRLVEFDADSLGLRGAE